MLGGVYKVDDLEADIKRQCGFAAEGPGVCVTQDLGVPTWKRGGGPCCPKRMAKTQQRDRPACAVSRRGGASCANESSLPVAKQTLARMTTGCISRNWQRSRSPRRTRNSQSSPCCSPVEPLGGGHRSPASRPSAYFFAQPQDLRRIVLEFVEPAVDAGVRPARVFGRADPPRRRRLSHHLSQHVRRHAAAVAGRSS